jgi:hypothetical protein
MKTNGSRMMGVLAAILAMMAGIATVQARGWSPAGRYRMTYDAQGRLRGANTVKATTLSKGARYGTVRAEHLNGSVTIARLRRANGAGATVLSERMVQPPTGQVMLESRGTVQVQFHDVAPRVEGGLNPR